MFSLLKLFSISNYCSNFTDLNQKINSVQNYSFYIEKNKPSCFHFQKKHSYFAFSVNKGENVQFSISKQKYFLNNFKFEFIDSNNFSGYFSDSINDHVYIIFTSNKSQEIVYSTILLDKLNCKTFDISTKEYEDITIKTDKYCYADLSYNYDVEISIQNNPENVILINNKEIHLEEDFLSLKTPFFLISRKSNSRKKIKGFLPSFTKEYINKTNHMKLSSNTTFIHEFKLKKSKFIQLQQNQIELFNINNETNENTDDKDDKLKIIGICIGSYYGLGIILLILLAIIASKHPHRLFALGWTFRYFYCCCKAYYERFDIFYDKNSMKSSCLWRCCSGPRDHLITVHKYPENVLPNMSYKWQHPDLYEPSILDDPNSSINQKTKELVVKYMEETKDQIETIVDDKGGYCPASFILCICCICCIPILIGLIIYFLLICVFFPFIVLYFIFAILFYNDSLEEQIFQSSEYILIPQRRYCIV